MRHAGEHVEAEVQVRRLGHESGTRHSAFSSQPRPGTSIERLFDPSEDKLVEFLVSHVTHLHHPPLARIRKSVEGLGRFGEPVGFCPPGGGGWKEAT